MAGGCVVQIGIHHVNWLKRANDLVLSGGQTSTCSAKLRTARVIRMFNRDMLVDVKLAHSGGRPSSWNELNIFIPPLAFPRISAAHVSYPDHAMLRKRRANWALRAFGQTPHLPLNVSSDEAARSVEPG